VEFLKSDLNTAVSEKPGKPQHWCTKPENPSYEAVFAAIKKR